MISATWPPRAGRPGRLFPSGPHVLLGAERKRPGEARGGPSEACPRDSGPNSPGDSAIPPENDAGRPGEVKKGRRQEDKPGPTRGPRPPPPHHALDDRREAPRGRGHGDQSQQPQGHDSAVSTGSRTRGDAVATGPLPRPARHSDVTAGMPAPRLSGTSGRRTQARRVRTGADLPRVSLGVRPFWTL